MITQARLKEVLNYDPLTGIFAWIKKTCRKVVVGAVAGHVADSGYVFIRNLRAALQSASLGVSVHDWRVSACRH